jgi:hypothetical protein
MAARRTKKIGMKKADMGQKWIPKLATPEL